MSQHHQTWSLSLKMSHYVISTLKLLFTELCIYKKLEHHKLAKIRFLYTFNAIKHGGRGGSKCPRHFKMFVAATGAYKSDPDFFTFPIYLLTKDLTKNFEKKIGGSPHFSPSKKVAQENDPTMAAYDPHFLSQNLFLL